MLTPLKGDETHCSAFAAAAADSLGIYLLHPPEHSHVLLANAQYAWLASDAARKAGWKPVVDAPAAQRLANAGQLVVAIYRNPDLQKPGHVALVRPEALELARIDRAGPQIAQAGYVNSSSIDLQTGFDRHPGAWLAGGRGGVRFYAHAVDANALAGE